MVTKRINLSKKIRRENRKEEKTKRRFREKDKRNGRDGILYNRKVIIKLVKAK